jgi:hypothetical protein
MDPTADDGRITWRTLVGLLVLALAVAAVAAPIGVWVEPPQRPVVVRVAAAVFLACALFRCVRAVAGAVGLDLESPADLAMRHAAPPPARPDPLLPILAAEIRHGLGRGCRLDRGLWARLQALARRRGVVLPPDALPRSRPPPGRMMTQADVDRAIGLIERAGESP